VADLLRLCRSAWIIFSRIEGEMPKIALRLFAVVAALLGGFSAHSAGAAEINVLCSDAMRAVLQQLTPAFEESSGDKLVVEYATGGKSRRRWQRTRRSSLAPTSWCASPNWSGARPRCWPAWPIGLAVKSGAPHPDIAFIES
jgi:hypothetical protein